MQNYSMQPEKFENKVKRSTIHVLQYAFTLGNGT